MALQSLSPPLALLFSHASSCRPRARSANRPRPPNAKSATAFSLIPSRFSPSSRRSFQHFSNATAAASSSGMNPSSGGDEITEMLPDVNSENGSRESSFLVMLAVALGVAAIATLVSAFSESRLEPSLMLPKFIGDSSQSVPVPGSVGFNVQFFGYQIVLPEYTPGWIYFWLLMAAGCGLFISEEALNVWVGITLARNLSLDGGWQSFMKSFPTNASYIISTILWVYWGVCISDMIPFYLGKFFRQTKASKDIYAKLGISKEKTVNISRVVQKYGNLIGFGPFISTLLGGSRLLFSMTIGFSFYAVVERFSVGARNPTAFLAGAWGISPEYFFAGVCCGGLITLPIQLSIGFFLREQPVFALASVATAVGIWTLFPYILAASTALFLYLGRPRSK